MSRHKTTAERWRGEGTDALVPGKARLCLFGAPVNLPV